MHDNIIHPDFLDGGNNRLKFISGIYEDDVGTMTLEDVVLDDINIIDSADGEKQWSHYI